MLFKIKFSQFLSVCLFFCSINANAQVLQNLKGTLFNEDTKEPLPRATVILENTAYQALSDDNGHFVFEQVPVGRYVLVASSVGYNTKRIAELLLQSGRELVVNVELSPSDTSLEEVTVTAASPNLSGALTSINTITTEQVMRYPATFMDPARLAQSFAGVANTNDQANGLSVRGNNPNSLQWRLEGVEIVNPNHLSNAGTFSDLPTQAGGGVNILSAQLLGNMNFLTGAFPAEYGNVIGGVMDMRLRKGNNEKRESIAQIGLVGIDLATEGPFSKNSKASYLVNYRYSFTGLLGAMGIDFGGEKISFQDLSFNLNFPTKKGEFTIFGMGGTSSNIFKSPEDPSLWTEEKDQYDIDFSGKMGAAGATYQTRLGRALWKNVLAVSATENNREQWQDSTINPIQFSYFKQLVSLRSEIITPIKDKNQLTVGTYFTHQNIRVSGSIPYAYGYRINFEPYVNLRSHPSDKLTTNIGLHLMEYYASGNSSSLEPRLSLKYQIDSLQNLSIAYGLHSQAALPQYFQNDHSLNKAHHFVVDYTLNISKSSYLKTELFFQSLFNMLQTGDSSAFLPDYTTINMIDFIPYGYYYNSAKGRNFGAELTFQKYLTNGFFLQSNLTLLKSFYSIEYSSNRKQFDTRFDVGHIFNLTLGKEWQKSKDRIWGVNGRVVWMGGFRDTPIDLTASQAAGKTVYVSDAPFTVKNPDYFRPDIRVYFRKSKQKYDRMLSIDIQNVAGYKNVAYKYYDNFVKEIVTKYQLGVIPMLNYRWEF